MSVAQTRSARLKMARRYQSGRKRSVAEAIAAEQTKVARAKAENAKRSQGRK